MNRPIQALPSGVDESTAELIMAFQFSSDSEVFGWFGLVRQTYNEAMPDMNVAEFASRLSSAASGCDTTSVQNFIQELERAADGLTPVERMLEVESRLPDLYWELWNQRYGAQAGEAYGASAAEGGRFGWLTSAQSSQLAAAWGQQWEYHLGEQLDARWGTGWESYPAEHKQAWFNDLLTELLAPAHASTEQARPQGAQAQTPPDTQDLSQIVEEMIRTSISEVEGADQLSAEQLAVVAAMVRQNIEGGQQ